jgi:hypothetical protein
MITVTVAVSLVVFSTFWAMKKLARLSVPIEADKRSTEQ